MKKILQTLFVFFITAGIGFAQVDVTLTVDVSNETVDATGVHVAGNWDSNHTWDPAAFPLTDNGDGTWTTTIQVAENSTFEYKFLLGNDWSLGNEGLPADAGCIVGNGNTNRIMAVTASDVIVPVVCYNSCGACAGDGESSVTFKVDMSTQSSIHDSVIVTGTLTGWTDSLFMTDYNADGIYNITVNLAEGDYEYKFKNGPSGWESVPADCAVNGNRGLTVGAEDMVLETVCMNMCGPCVETNDVYVTFKLDMSLTDELDGISPLGVHVAGNFQAAAGYDGDWNPGITELTDADGDLIYELTVLLPEGEYQYKYLNGDAWGTEEGVPEECNVSGNRAMVVEGNEGDTIVIGPFCFSSCTADCPVLGDPINVTFKVDMNAEFLHDDGLFVTGDFFKPKWKKDSFQMTETDVTGIYQAVAQVRPGIKYVYKFFNGGAASDATEESGNFVEGGCGVDNNFGGYNRLLDLESATADTILPAYIFNSCDISTAAVGELDYLVEFDVFPNPSGGEVTISFASLESDKKHKVQLFNLLGELVYETPFSSASTFVVDKENLSTGVFVGQLINEENQKHSFKLIFN